MSERETGLRAIGAAPRAHVLRAHGKDVATVYPNGGGWRRAQDGWYWVVPHDGVAPYRNTCDTPLPDLAAAKAACKAYVQAHLEAKEAALRG